MKQRRLIIFTAVEIEARAVARALGGTYTFGNSTVVERDRISVEVYLVGIGARHLPKHLKAEEVTAIVMAGLAGALDPSLRAGDVVVNEELGRRVGDLKLKMGKIHTARRVVATPEEKAALHKETGALAVEMENAVVRAEADRLGVPFYSVRAISDRADQVLDGRLLKFVDEFGRPRLGAIALGVIRRPKLIPYLQQIGAQSRLAARNLGEAIRDIIPVLTAGDLE